MALTNVIINGRVFPSHDAFALTNALVGSFVRNANGNMVGDLVAVKAVINIGWHMLSGEEYGRLLAECANVFGVVEYFDPVLGQAVRKNMHIGLKGARVALVSMGEMFWKDVACVFTEQ